MQPFESFVHRVFWGSLALVLVPAGILVLAGYDPYARGVALGGAASLINLVLMAHLARLHANPSRGFRVSSVASYSIRMGISAAALVYAAVSDDVALMATIPALFCVQVVLLLGEVTGWLEGPD